MSTICYKPINIDLPKNALKECFNKGIDGAGFSFAADGVIYTKKGFKSFDNLFDALLKVEKLACLITFSTREIPNESKFLQPLKLDNNHFVAYDGVLLPRKDLNDPLCSQGYNFINILNNFDFTLFKKDYFIALLNSALSKSNSGCAAVMNNSGEVFIFNKSHGTELLKCWFSSNPYYNTNISNQHSCQQNANIGNAHKCGGCNAWFNLSSLTFNLSKNRYHCKECDRRHQSETVQVNKSYLPEKREQFKTANPYQDHLIGLKNITNIDLINILDLV